mmetsp:Transcript_29833/g.65049  ORF Transcript_29833/g.65049 Transcript_29833/m.65049 type:complete len:232 (-) Transcript_29833:198-893(-)
MHKAVPQTPVRSQCRGRSTLHPTPAPQVGESRLFRALERCRGAEVSAALDENPDAARCEEDILCSAVYFGCGADVVRQLLEKGANVNGVNPQGQTALALLCATPAVPAIAWSFSLHVAAQRPAFLSAPGVYDTELASFLSLSPEKDNLKADFEAEHLNIAACLLNSGSCLLSGGNLTLEQVARASGRPRLAGLVSSFQAAQASIALQGACSLGLPQHLETVIVSFLSRPSI